MAGLDMANGRSSGLFPVSEGIAETLSLFMSGVSQGPRSDRQSNDEPEAGLVTCRRFRELGNFCVAGLKHKAALQGGYTPEELRAWSKNIADWKQARPVSRPIAY
jgi:hypothetical protein